MALQQQKNMSASASNPIFAWGQEAMEELTKWTKGNSTGSPPHKIKRKDNNGGSDKENKDPQGQAAWLTDALGVALGAFGTRVQTELQRTNSRIDEVKQDVQAAVNRVEVMEADGLKRKAEDVGRDEEIVALRQRIFFVLSNRWHQRQKVQTSLQFGPKSLDKTMKSSGQR